MEYLKKYSDLNKLIQCTINRFKELEGHPEEWKQEFDNTKLKLSLNKKMFPSFIKKAMTNLHKLKRELESFE